MAMREEMRLVAVYDTDDDAKSAVSVLERAGVSPNAVRLEQARDHVTALQGEMRSETINSVAGPGSVGPWTKEMAQGMTVGAIVGGVIGLVVALPFAAIDFGMEWWTRMILLAIVGIAVGGTFGFVVGGGFGAKKPDEALAAERGVTLSVPSSPAARTALLRTDPIRLDLVQADGRPVIVVTERDAGAGHIVRDIGRHMGEEPRTG